MIVGWSEISIHGFVCFLFEWELYPRELHVLTHSFPTRRASALRAPVSAAPAAAGTTLPRACRAGRGRGSPSPAVRRVGAGCRWPERAWPASPRRAVAAAGTAEIGRASCRERVCQHV